MHPDDLLSPRSRCTLYRLFDADSNLLYVGIATNPQARFRTHRGDKAWWPAVASVTLTEFATRSDAAAAEKEAIRNESPLHNHVHNHSRQLSPSEQTPETDPEMLALQQAAAEAVAAFKALDTDAPDSERAAALLRTVATQGAVYQARRARMEQRREELHAAIVAAAPCLSKSELAKLSGLSRTAIHCIVGKPSSAL